MGYAGGELDCRYDCTLDISQCRNAEVCGDGVAEGSEECDGNDLRLQDCLLLGYGPGILACTSACRYDITACEQSCGDGTCETDRGETTDNCFADCHWNDLSAGSEHTCALDGDALIWCWGDNDFWQLGDGIPVDRDIPSRLWGMPSAIQVAAGGHSGPDERFAHTCALSTHGNVWCWGDNSFGQFGTGTMESSFFPVQSPMVTVRQLVVGARHTCALTQNGTVWCWGRNRFCQCGDVATLTDKVTPVLIDSLVMPTAVAAGRFHVCALENNGDVLCWGASQRLGSDAPGQYQCEPVQTPVGGIAESIAAGFDHTCAVRQTGDVRCWGDNSSGQLGDGTPNARVLPVTVVGLGNIRQVATGGLHTCAVGINDSVWCWGENRYGQLGDGTSTGRLTPVPVNGLTDVETLRSGQFHTCALTYQGEIFCWGLNSNGQLGTGTPTGPESCGIDLVPCSRSPVEITPPVSPW